MFNKARLKLTFYYLLIIMIICISFSALIYKSDVAEVERLNEMQMARIELHFGPPPLDWGPTLVEETERRIITNLVIMNLTILVISGLSGYILAGLTLNPIKEMVDKQNRFISDASHEINTPLTSLKLALEVYLRNKKQTLTESRQLVKESIEEVNKLQSLSHSLLQLARFEIPNGNVKPENFNLSEIADEAIKKVSPMASKKKIKIEKRIKKAYITASKHNITDLLVILLDNAIKYSPAGSVVKIFSHNKNDSIEIIVKDNGIGISKEDLPHIFDRFYRADLARGRKTSGGYGLGLSIAKKIIESNHGNISVKSELGKGSEFIATLNTDQRKK